MKEVLGLVVGAVVIGGLTVAAALRSSHRRSTPAASEQPRIVRGEPLAAAAEPFCREMPMLTRPPGTKPEPVPTDEPFRREMPMLTSKSTRDDPLPQTEGSRSFRLGVVGESHDNVDGTSRQRIIRKCSAGECVQLVFEPDNPHDRRAVKVCRQSGEQVGYLPRGHGLFEGIKDGRVSAVIDGVHGGVPGKPSRGVVLAITVRE